MGLTSAMDLARIGILLPAESTDPEGDARRVESLGFGHVTLELDSSAVALLVLGATRTLRVFVPQDVIEHLARLDSVPSERLARLGRTHLDDQPLSIDPTDVVAARRAVAHRLADVAHATVEIVGPHAAGVRALALDVVSTGAPVQPSAKLFAEDLDVGQRFDLGTYELTVDEIVSFAERFDPLDFHIDPDLAAASPLGVLCASGIHTQAIMQRLSARGFTRRIAVVAGRAMLGMRLPAPATPGQVLRGTTEVAEVRLRPSGRAVVTTRSTLHADEDLILEVTGEIVVQQRGDQHQ